MSRPTILIFALLWSLALAHAPSTQAQATLGADTSQTEAASYRLGPGDVISIEVTNFPELSTTHLTIPLDGKLTVQFVDSLPVTGMTTTELAQLLTQRWSEYVVKPSVTVTVVQKREEHGEICIVGAVRNPSLYHFKTPTTILDALAAAGGPRDDADLAHVMFLHEGKQSVLNVKALLAQGRKEDTPKAAPGDKVDPTPLLSNGGLASNIRLSPGDWLIIPTLNNSTLNNPASMLNKRVVVYGEVAHAGPYHFKEGDRISDALKACGGVTDTSDLTKVRLIHHDTLKHIKTDETVNMNRFYINGDASANLLLSPEDEIYVPSTQPTPLTPRFMLITPGDTAANGRSLRLPGR